MCYSLYLVHQIPVKAVSAALYAWGFQSGVATLVVVTPASVVLSLLLGRLFFVTVESRFLNPPMSTAGHSPASGGASRVRSRPDNDRQGVTHAWHLRHRHGFSGRDALTGGRHGVPPTPLSLAADRSTWVSSDGHAGLATVTLDSQGAAAIAELFGVALAFDGELYAAKETRAHLARHGVHFLGDSILELLMHGLTRGGPAVSGVAPRMLCRRACGTEQKQRLTLISDRFGMRPLYWAQVNGALVFASEIKALLAVPGLSRKMSRDGLAQFFAFGQYLGDRTSFDAISVLPAASLLEFDLATGRVQVESYGGVEPGAGSAGDAGGDA